MDTIWHPDVPAGAPSKQAGIAASIRDAIASGRLSAGDRLPPVREVAWTLGVTPGTVARAYKDLVASGVLAAQVGRGTFVAGTEPRAAVPLLEHTPDEMANLATAQVADVGQGARFHAILTRLPPPAPGDYARYPKLTPDTALTRALAPWFSGPDHGAIPPEDLVPTLGGQQGLIVCLSALLAGPRPVILTEELSYPGSRHAAALLRAEIRGVPTDGEGVIPEALDEAAARSGAQVLLTSAHVHNPTTVQTSDGRRRAIAAVARARGLAILDDDCFGFSDGAGPSYRLIAPERTWVIGSLSKSLSPDLRVGAVIAPPGQAARVRAAAQQHFFGLPRPVVDLVVAALGSGEAAEILREVRAVAAARVRLAGARLGRFGIALREDAPFGWLPMPRGWRASSFVRAAEAEGIRIKAGDQFALVDGRAPNAVRLAFTAVRGEAAFVAALDRLAALLDAPPHEFEA